MPSWMGSTSRSLLVSGQLFSVIQRRASFFMSAYVDSAFFLMHFFLSLFEKVGCKPLAWVSRSVTSDKVSGFTEVCFRPQEANAGDILPNTKQTSSAPAIV